MQIHKKFLLFSFITFCFVSVAQNVGNKIIPNDANNMKNPISNTPASLNRGIKVYKKVCMVCHGTLGKGDGPQAADIETKPADFNDPIIKSRTDGALFWWISNGGNDMEPFKEVLAPDDIWNVVNYIRSIQNTVQ